MSKNCIFTVALGDYYQAIAKLTHPSIKAYAKKIGADFFEITDENKEFVTQKWNKFYIHELLNKYQRVLWVDSDIIIRPDAPNIFDVVPENEFGIFNEGKYSERSSFIKEGMEHYGMKFEWEGQFYNSGVMVASRRHKQLFKMPKDVDKVETDQVYITCKLLEDKIDVHSLSYKFNRMSILDEKIGVSRLDSYFIHYAGAPEDQLFPVLMKDMLEWEQDAPDYKYVMSIVISVSAGMGDQLCAEPVIRYIKEKKFPDADIYVVTHHPRLFQHIPDITLMSYKEYEGMQTAVLVLYTTPEDAKSEHHLSHVFFHPTDFAAISTIKQTLPTIDKSIKLEVFQEDLDEVESIFEDVDLEDLIAVHPGKWWPSKTFPKEWWQEVVDKLAEKGHKLALIGKTIDEKQGFVNIDCPEGSYDFRDLTSLGGLIALISKAKITLTNDSSPIHIAGAFDNWIVTVPTCKMADHILPYRHETQAYKTKAICKKLVLEDLDINWLSETPDNIDTVNGDLIDYLPEPDEIVEAIEDIVNGEA